MSQLMFRQFCRCCSTILKVNCEDACSHVDQDDDRKAIRIREEILSETGAEVSNTISVQAALNPTPSSPNNKAPADPGDEDPCRKMPSAEIAMTFNGRSNHGSADLAPFTKKRFVEIAKRQLEARKKAEEAQSPDLPCKTSLPDPQRSLRSRPGDTSTQAPLSVLRRQ